MRIPLTTSSLHRTTEIPHTAESGARPDAVMGEIYRRGDRWIRAFIGVHLLLAAALAPVHGTWHAALLVGGGAAASFFVSAWRHPGSFLTRCLAGIALQAFCALHIYQMHGLAEMHFFFFTAVTMMLVYQDWRAPWPGVLLIIAQHLAFSILHNAGVEVRSFDAAHVSGGKLAFHLSIAAVQAAITSYWAFTLQRQTRQDATQRTAYTGVAAELREMQTKLERLLDASPTVLYSMHISGDTITPVWVSPNIVRVMGYTVEEALDPAWWAGRVHPEDRAIVLAEGVDFRCDAVREYRFRHKNTSYHWVRDESRLTPGGDASVAGLVGAWVDITESKRAEEALRVVQQQQQAAMLSNIPDIAWVKDAESRFLAVNDAFARACGLPREQVVGKTDLDLWPRTLAEKYRTDDRAVLARGERIVAEELLQQPDGTTQWIETIKTPFYGAAGAIAGTAGIARDITARKHAEQESQRMVSTLMSNLPGMVYRRRNDPCWTVEFASAGCLKLTGHPPANLVENRVLSQADLIHPEDRELVWNSVQRALQERRSFELSYRIRTADGAAKTVWEHGCGVFSSEGELIALEGFIADITERQRAEEALRKSEASLAAAQQLAHLGSWELDLDNLDDINRNALRWSDEVYRIFGFQPREFEPSSDAFFRSVHPEDRAAIAEAVADALEQCTPYALEHRILLPDGSERVVYERAEVVRDATGRPIRMVGTVQDITERKRTDEALRNSEQLFRSLIENTSDIISILNADGTIRYESPSNERVLGYKNEELVGRSAFDLIHPDDVAQVTEAFTRVVENPGLPVTVEYRFRHKDGSWRILAAVGKNLLDLPAVGGIVVNSRDVTERKRLEAQLSHQAFHDTLTGLANRALFHNRVEHALARTGRERDAVAVLFLDLDDFKRINDSLGHAAGDRLLVAVSERLLSATRGCDTVARLGGDEFAILLESMRDDGDALTVTTRITTALRPPFALDGREVFMSASIGIARARTAGDVDALLRNADVAMYLAKNSGKGRHALFEPAMHAAVLERVQLEADLRRALECGEFRLHYQPIVRLACGEMTGVEALVRWEHPQRGLVSPAAFIPVAEQTGLMVPLGRWVLREACRQVRCWHEQRAADASLTLTVNISGRQLHDATIVDDVRGALCESGLDARNLVLEITESVLMEHTEVTLETLHALKALGVQLAIDDFGTGYSSLSYLQRFPVDMLKIDKSFVDDVGFGKDPVIARAIVALGETLRLRTVAEGIEHAAQVEGLRFLGCEFGQGYYFARPLTAEALGEFLGQPRPRVRNAVCLSAG